MNRLKVMTILGTRPEIIRLSACIKACDLAFEHTLCHTGQNYDFELNEVFFRDLKLRAPDDYLGCAGAHLGETMGNVLAKSYALLSEKAPDALLILGDTNSALCAISAKRLKIPIFHMEAGNRCFDQNVPEEINRRIVDHTADVNLAYTEHGRRYLLSEGLPAEYTFVTGSPMREVLEQNREGISHSGALDTLGLRRNGYIVLSAHREENVDHEGSFLSLMNAVNSVAEKFGMPIVFSVHPRSRERIASRGFVLHPLVKRLPPFGFHDYIRLQTDAFAVLSDSGTLSEESAILRFPAVLLRTSTERPEAVDKGGVILGGVTETTILQALSLVTSPEQRAHNFPEVPDYADNDISQKVVRIIQGYTALVNKRVWRKG